MTTPRCPLMLACTLAVIALGCQTGGGDAVPPTAEEAHRFIQAAEKRLETLGKKASRAGWVQNNFITVDTQKIAADAQSDFAAAVTELAPGARRFEGLQLPIEDARKLKLLKLQLSAPAPDDPAERDELSSLSSSLEGDYGKGKYCRNTQEPRAARGDGAPQAKRLERGEGPPRLTEAKRQCLDIDQASNILASSRDPNELVDVWQGWHRVGAPMRDRYSRFVELSNEGARELGFADTGVLWRSNYDMPPDAFSAEVDRLWAQVQPLYASLHTYVRSNLAEKYGAGALPANGMLPAHLLGNMWAQDWSNIYPLVAPPESGEGYDLTAALKQRKVDERGLVRYAESFFTSLGYQALPPAFWERSLFTKPADRDVVCHASASGWDAPEDVRIKMCIEINAEDFQVVHHELGHDYYGLLYAKQPYFFRDAAIDAFHEAVGDLIALSATPGYLKQIGLIDRVPSEKADLEYLLKTALLKVAFLPFGAVIDQWRWRVFSGEIPPARYNQAWWELRNKYQGITAPLPRTEADFDPGAKYHVPANTPYTRYFLSNILQFQFHRALCREAGFTGPLYRCSIYGNKTAGAKFAKMLAMGSSRPWPEALAALSGESAMDATAILDYFAPLKAWLDDQNRNAKPGWSPAR
jgi:peptidyl-dipeptidase A